MQKLPINPALLKWARTEAGLNLYEAAQRAKITKLRPKKGEQELSPEERLDSWENGSDTPSLTQLQNIAKAYRRPLITFFLPDPPATNSILVDFRTVQHNNSAKDTPEFAALKRRITLLHKELKSLEQEEQKELSFVESLSLNTPVSDFVTQMRSTLGISFEDQQKIRSKDDILNHLRKAAHNAGIFVLFEGDLGSHHSNIDPVEFRGIAISDKSAPLIVVNKNDAKAAMIFTFVHELAHIWLGANGISNFDFLKGNGNNRKEEQLCNAVAAEFLVPEANLRQQWSRNDTLMTTTDSLAQVFKVSGAVIGRRLLDIKLISQQEYNTLLSYYQIRWQNKKQKTKDKQSNGPNRNVLDIYRLGQKTIQTFIEAAHAGKISLQETARLLNIPVSRFNKVAQ